MQYHPNSSPSPSPRPRAFTLTEMLIVMGLIVLIILLALPAFNALTGGRSMEAADNQISALLGRARAEAIGLQEVAGVMFFVNPRNDRITAALVREVQPQSAANTSAGIVYLDRIPNRDFIPLPVGIDLQMIDEAALSGSTRQDNGYIGYNRPNNTAVNTTTPIGGVILFDGDGRLISRRWALIAWQDPPPNPNGSNPPPVLTDMGRLVHDLVLDTPRDVSDTAGDQFMRPGMSPGDPANPDDYLKSQFGFVLVETELFRGPGYDRADRGPDMGGSYTGAGPNGEPPEIDEETWIDENGLPFLVNRYNGTLTRGE